MKRILAIDTSSWWGGVALVERANSAARPSVVAEFGAQVRDSHAVHLLDWIEQVLAIAGWRRSDLDQFVAIRGPGSFTGIRIGLGAARGLSLAAGRPCCAVGTLPAIAEAFGPAPAERLTLLDAGRNEVYAARFDPAASPPREIEGPFRARLEPGVVRGERPAILIHAQSLRQRVTAIADDPRIVGVSAAPLQIAGAAGRLCLMRENGASPQENFAPLYLRPPDAELNPRPR